MKTEPTQTSKILDDTAHPEPLADGNHVIVNEHVRVLVESEAAPLSAKENSADAFSFSAWAKVG